MLFIYIGLIIYLVFSFNVAFNILPSNSPTKRCYFFYNNDHRRHSVNIWLIYMNERESFPYSKELKMTLIMICQNYSPFLSPSISLTLSISLNHSLFSPLDPLFSLSQLTIYVTSFRRNVTFPTLYSRWDGYTFQEDLLRRIRKDWRSC